MSEVGSLPQHKPLLFCTLSITHPSPCVHSGPTSDTPSTSNCCSRHMQLRNLLTCLQVQLCLAFVSSPYPPPTPSGLNHMRAQGSNFRIFLSVTHIPSLTKAFCFYLGNIPCTHPSFLPPSFHLSSLLKTDSSLLQPLSAPFPSSFYPKWCSLKTNWVTLHFCSKLSQAPYCQFLVFMLGSLGLWANWVQFSGVYYRMLSQWVGPRNHIQKCSL